MSERLKLYLPLLVFAVLASLLYWGLGRDPRELPSALIGRPVPVFTLPALGEEGRIPGNFVVDKVVPMQSEEGRSVEDRPVEKSVLTQAIFAGQVSLLNVWATWCVSCRVEHPYLMEIAATGVPIIGLNYKDENAAAHSWLRDFGDPYQHNIVDAQGTMGLDLGVYGAPETYLIDRDGIIRYRHVGVVDDRVWATKLEPLYRRLLDAPDGD